MSFPLPASECDFDGGLTTLASNIDFQAAMSAICPLKTHVRAQFGFLALHLLHSRRRRLVTRRTIAKLTPQTPGGTETVRSDGSTPGRRCR